MSHRLFICCCKGFFRDENRDELYHLLDVDRRATAADIKRAYRNKSLQMHPDKLNQRGQEVTDEDKANFQKMKSAYDVLSDPQKRELYDQMGETGMLMMEDPFAAKDNMVKNFLTMSTRDRLRLVIFVLLFVGAVLLWPILFCAKVDGETSASWVALWTPLWIYNALGLWYFMYLVGLGKIKAPEGMEEGWTDPYPLPLRILALVKWVLLVLFQIFLTLRLDDDIDWSYAAVLTPLLAWVMLTVLAHVYEATRPVPAEINDESILHDDDEYEPPDAEKRQQAIAKRNEARSALLKDGIWILQLVFLILQLDEQVDWNWWFVFFPTWVVLFVQLAGFCVDFTLAKKLAAGIEGKEDDDLSEEERMRVAAASQLIANAVTSCCCWTFTFITVILAVAAIAGADYSAYVIFIPQFVIAGLLVCCMTCIICCVRGLPEDDLENTDDEERGRVSTSPHHVPTSYNTYNPPSVPGGTTGVNAPASSASKTASSSVPSGVVIAMPPPAAAAGDVEEGGHASSSANSNAHAVRAPVDARPVQATTPAPENQADGGID